MERSVARPPREGVSPVAAPHTGLTELVQTVRLTRPQDGDVVGMLGNVRQPIGNPETAFAVPECIIFQRLCLCLFKEYP